MTSSKIRSDVKWNLFSFTILGLSGILLNIVIGRFYDSETLGVFNQAFAFYIAVSQIAVFGLQFSGLKFVAEQIDNSALRDEIISPLLILTLGCASITIFLFYISSNFFLTFFDSDNLVASVLYITPGIFFFALNKVIINIVNALRHMRAFAMFQSSRYLGILVGVTICILWQVPGNMITLAITLTEFFLFLSLILYLLFNIGYRLTSISWPRIKELAHFGRRSFIAGAVSELNTRVDILMLGLFVSDALLGIYSMAAMLAEGVAQLAIVIRNVLNPIITKHFYDREVIKLTQLLAKFRNQFYWAMAAVTSISLLLYPLFLEILVGNDQFNESFGIYAVLVAGIAVAAGYLPFEMFFVQAGKPNFQSIFKLSIFGCNIGLNLVLIPIFGIYGAAIATGLVYIFTALFIKYGIAHVFSVHL